MAPVLPDPVVDRATGTAPDDEAYGTESAKCQQIVREASFPQPRRLILTSVHHHQRHESCHDARESDDDAANWNVVGKIEQHFVMVDGFFIIINTLSSKSLVLVIQSIFCNLSGKSEATGRRF